MDLAECRRQANGDVEEASQIERLPLVLRKNPIERLTAQVLEDQDRPTFVTSERQMPGCRRGIEFCGERVFRARAAGDFEATAVPRRLPRPGQVRGLPR